MFWVYIGSRTEHAVREILNAARIQSSDSLSFSFYFCSSVGGPVVFLFCTAFTHVIISLSQTHRYLVSSLFCFVRAVLFFLYVYRNSVWSSARLAVLHIVAIVNRTEPDLDVVVAKLIQINYSRFYSRRL